MIHLFAMDIGYLVIITRCTWHVISNPITDKQHHGCGGQINCMDALKYVGFSGASRFNKN